MHRILPSRPVALAAACLLLLLSVTLMAPPRADALPECGRHFNYFDSTHTFHVGYRKYDCENVLVASWGTVTGWFDYYEYLWCCEPA